MKIIYKAKLKEPVRLEDYWPAPFMQGEFCPAIEGDQIVAFEISFTCQPVTLAPKWEQMSQGIHRGSITIRDDLFPFVKMQLAGALAFIQCYFNVDVADEIEIEYIPETDEEDSQIPIKSWKRGKAEDKIPLTYDYFTRAIMAAEKGPAPIFEATLVRSAYNAMRDGKFIDSFRYSFLLIDATYGDGKFRKEHLKDAFSESDELKGIIETVINDPMSLKKVGQSDTGHLIFSKPDPERIIEHLIDKRGFYFHGNRKRKDSWKPQEQKGAEDLCFLALEIAMGISHLAAAAMFENELSQRHFENAKKKGATMTLKVSFQYRDPGDPVDQNASMNIHVPGTKVTPKMGPYVAQQFLSRFEEVNPVGVLKTATCVAESTGQKLFDITFHTSQD